MANEVVPYGEVERMATAVAKSGLFGVKNVEQALALMLVAQAEGRHPALAARDYDIIQGRPAKKSEAMMRDFLESGGKVEWHQLDDAIADASFSHPSGGTVRIAWDMKRAAAAGLGGKEMWKKWPRQMLRARCTSEGIRTVCPMATSGMYVPEEVRDFSAERVEKNITPSSGVEERITTEEVTAIDALAVKVAEWIESGSLEDAVLEIENAGLEADQKVYLWKQFDSKQRAALKKEAKILRDKHNPPEDVEPIPGPIHENATTVIDAATGNVISDAQRKRLEARIGELKLDRNNVKAGCKLLFGKDHFKDLTPAEYKQFDAALEKMQPKTEVV